MTLKTYSHLGLEDVADELGRMEDMDVTRKRIEKTTAGKSVSQKCSGQFDKEMVRQSTSVRRYFYNFISQYSQFYGRIIEAIRKFDFED